MASSHYLVAVFFSVITCSSSCAAPVASHCNQDSGIVGQGTVSTNIAELLANSVQVFDSGARFWGSSFGMGPNLVYGSAVCWGDVSKDCLLCIKSAAQDIQNSCNRSEAQVWYDYCSLSYSPEIFFNTYNTSKGAVLRNAVFLVDINYFRRQLRALFDQLIEDVLEPSSGGFASGERDLGTQSVLQTVFGMAQCSQDLTSTTCAECLKTGIQEFEGYCDRRRGCKVL